ncbi:MAG: 50S ribosomal protein L25 [Candidatus Eisenbacteria bacterium]
MAVISIKGDRRDTLGKGGARKARAKGLIPAVLYGHGETPLALTVQNREFVTSMHQHKGSNPILSVQLGGGEYTALLRDVQYDPLTHEILHLDFQHISLTEKVEVKVPVHLVGTPIGVKDAGGILEVIVRDIEVRCLPTAIPAFVELDVSALGIGDSIHARDLKITDIEVLTDPETTVATVVPPTVMEEKPVEAVVETAEPEVVGAKGKKDEEGAAPEKAEKEKEKDEKKDDKKDEKKEKK